MSKYFQHDSIHLWQFEVILSAVFWLTVQDLTKRHSSTIQIQKLAPSLLFIFLIWLLGRREPAFPSIKQVNQDPHTIVAYLLTQQAQALVIVYGWLVVKTQVEASVQIKQHLATTDRSFHGHLV